MCRLQQADYPPNPRVVAEARLWLARLLARWDLTDVTDAAGLLLTELVTNAVVHARSQVHVVAAVADGMVEVGVADQAPPSRLPGLPDLTPGQIHEVTLAGLPERRWATVPSEARAAGTARCPAMRRSRAPGWGRP